MDNLDIRKVAGEGADIKVSMSYKEEKKLSWTKSRGKNGQLWANTSDGSLCATGLLQVSHPKEKKPESLVGLG